MALFDLERAAEWTSALAAWCEHQPDLVPYRGQCLVHRSEILQAQGAWTEAIAEVEEARRQLTATAHPAVGLALYQQAELYRLRGEHEAADAGVPRGQRARPRAVTWARAAVRRSRQPRIGAGHRRPHARRDRGRIDRPTMLSAAVDVRLAAGDVVGARAACEELSMIADPRRPAAHRQVGVRQRHRPAREGDAHAALSALRRACTAWLDLEMPYDFAWACVRSHPCAARCATRSPLHTSSTPRGRVRAARRPSRPRTARRTGCRRRRAVGALDRS